MALFTDTDNLVFQSPETLEQLLGRTLVLTAHPDDELACAMLLQRIREPLVVVTTDGAPQDPFFWSPYGSRENYAAVRRQEAIESLESIGVNSVTFLNDCSNGVQFADQGLHRNLIDAFWLLLPIIEEFAPDAILVPAYEGGHPDHDACSFLASMAGAAFGVPVWEMPLYHRNSAGQLVNQEFLELYGNEAMIVGSNHEIRGRSRMLSKYLSQTDVAEFVTSSEECYRPQPSYDYSRPPHSGLLNYEYWQWPISGEEVSQAMRKCHTYIQRTLSKRLYGMRTAEWSREHVGTRQHGKAAKPWAVYVKVEDENCESASEFAL